jgi:large subunit ribosomal protein L46
MNMWIVGNQPIGHFKRPYSSDAVKANDKGHPAVGDMTFFMKGRIMAGQANLSNNKLGAKDFRWLSKDEIQLLVHPKYWKAIHDMLPDR